MVWFPFLVFRKLLIFYPLAKPSPVLAPVGFVQRLFFITTSYWEEWEEAYLQPSPTLMALVTNQNKAGHSDTKAGSPLPLDWNMESPARVAAGHQTSTRASTVSCQNRQFRGGSGQVLGQATGKLRVGQGWILGVVESTRSYAPSLCQTFSIEPIRFVLAK